MVDFFCALDYENSMEISSYSLIVYHFSEGFFHDYIDEGREWETLPQTPFDKEERGWSAIHQRYNLGVSNTCFNPLNKRIC
jgi:hypothetical protein